MSVDRTSVLSQNPLADRVIAQITEQRPHRPQKRKSDDFLIHVGRARPLIAEGKYQARSSWVSKRHFWERYYVDIGFTVFRGEATNGEVLATRVSAFFNLNDDDHAGPESRLGRLIRLAAPDVGEVSVRVLKDKLWLVEVVTVDTDKRGNPLAPELHYSKVGDVLERLA